RRLDVVHVDHPPSLDEGEQIADVPVGKGHRVVRVDEEEREPGLGSPAVTVAVESRELLGNVADHDLAAMREPSVLERAAGERGVYGIQLERDDTASPVVFQRGGHM